MISYRTPFSIIHSFGTVSSQRIFWGEFLRYNGLYSYEKCHTNYCDKTQDVNVNSPMDESNLSICISQLPVPSCQFLGSRLHNTRVLRVCSDTSLPKCPLHCVCIPGVSVFPSHIFPLVYNLHLIPHMFTVYTGVDITR